MEQFNEWIGTRKPSEVFWLGLLVGMFTILCSLLGGCILAWLSRPWVMPPPSEECRGILRTMEHNNLWTIQDDYTLRCMEQVDLHCDPYSKVCFTVDVKTQIRLATFKKGDAAHILRAWPVLRENIRVILSRKLWQDMERRRVAALADPALSNAVSAMELSVLEASEPEISVLDNYPPPVSVVPCVTSSCAARREARLSATWAARREDRLSATVYYPPGGVVYSTIANQKPPVAEEFPEW